MNTTWLALRNVGRNRRRTFLLLMIMTIGTTGLIMNSGLITYIFNGLRDVAIYGRFGHIQVLKHGYKLNHTKSPFEYWILRNGVCRYREKDPADPPRKIRNCRSHIARLSLPGRT